jgi:hypothetical protein
MLNEEAGFLACKNFYIRVSFSHVL